MESIIELIQFTQVIFLLYLFYAIIDIKSTRIEIFTFGLLVLLFISLKLGIVENIFNIEPYSVPMEFLWWVYNTGVYLYFFIYITNNYGKNKTNTRI